MRRAGGGSEVAPVPEDRAQSSVVLSDLAAGRSATITGIMGSHGFASRLLALGFTLGARVTVLRNSGRSAMIVSVLDTRIALGRGQACSVHIRPAEQA